MDEVFEQLYHEALHPVRLSVQWLLFTRHQKAI